MEYCIRCRSEPRWDKNRWRPQVTDRHEPIIETIGDLKYVLLEQYERLVCRCSAPCTYAPLGGMSPPAQRWFGR